MSEARIQAIVAKFGGDLLQGGRAALIPGPGHSRRDRSLSMTLGHNGQLLFHSFAGDSLREICAYLGEEQGANIRSHDPMLHHGAKQAADHARKRLMAEQKAWCGKVWDQTVAAERSLVETYFRHRGIGGPIPKVIRYHPDAPLTYGCDHRSPAMIALVQNKAGDPCGLHVTSLMADGADKAAGKSRRMFGSVKGGAIRLSEHSGHLAVAEGIETALSHQRLTQIPTWSCLSASGLAGFDIPRGVRQLTIAADGDEAGLKAANTLLEQAQTRCEVRLNPAPMGKDWNDVLKDGQ